MAQKKKDPWGDTSSSPFSTTHNTVTGASSTVDDPSIDWGPILDGTNRRRNMEKGMQEGFVRAEDGSLVPRSYYGGGGGGGRQNPYGNVGGRGGGGGPCKPGYVMAEDGTCVPESFYANARGKTGINAKTGKPIEW